ncbi:MAG TPA: phasin family protein [Xanthobacteraceae bacterium]|nr:phasin family protein [Xanthobacteraceae bacterium]
MVDVPSLEVPAELRAFAEKSIEQARKAVDGFLDAAHKAVGETEKRVDGAHENARGVGRTAAEFVEANVAASFEFAAQLVKATTVEEVVRLQSTFATEQMKRLSDQARAIGEAGQKLRP